MNGDLYDFIELVGSGGFYTDHDQSTESLGKARRALKAQEQLIETLTSALQGCLGIFEDAKAKYPQTAPSPRTTAAMERARAALSKAQVQS